MSDVNKLCVQLATSREQRSLNEKELDDAAKCDDECKEEERWYADNDQEYDDDFAAQWGDEPDQSDGEQDFIDNERDKW